MDADEKKQGKAAVDLVGSQVRTKPNTHFVELSLTLVLSYQLSTRCFCFWQNILQSLEGRDITALLASSSYPALLWFNKL
jgi:hypothetical protein